MIIGDKLCGLKLFGYRNSMFSSWKPAIYNSVDCSWNRDCVFSLLLNGRLLEFS